MGILMGKYERWNQWLDLVVYLVYPIPKMALLPVALLFFGISDWSKIALLVIVVLPQVTVSVRGAIQQIPLELYQVV
ncbi:ABC transporter permease subunit [Dolosicoccus paucivorans]|uniref:ABC transporter permease subunit n=1 Tax=Dolosicoccus paucivorans TaxID=84521 RepID=UPI002E0DAA46